MNALEFGKEKERVSSYCNGKQSLVSLYSGDAAIIDKLETAVVGTGICRAPYCPPGGVLTDELAEEHLNWSFAGSCFFCFTVMTTIGYGNYVPVTGGGRAFTLCFAVPGFVIHAFAINNFTKLLDHTLFEHLKKGGKKVPLWRRVLTDFVLLLAWLLIMAAVYGAAEGWAYGDAFYFSYISSTSIGLGDFAPMKTRDWPLSYVLIFIGLLLMGNFIAAFIHVFHDSVLTHATVNLDEKVKEKDNTGVHGLLWTLMQEYLRNWKLQLTVLWVLVLCYMFTGAAIFRGIELYGLGSGGTDGVFGSALAAVTGEATEMSAFLQKSLANATHSVSADSAKITGLSDQWGKLKELMNDQGEE
jgi:hypothetical protein